MFARHFTVQIKPKLEKEFAAAFENQILPIMRRQKGFLDELMLVTPNKKEVIFVSLWETQESIEAYHRHGYPEVDKLLAKFTDAKPVIKNLDVECSTFRAAATVGA